MERGKRKWSKFVMWAVFSSCFIYIFKWSVGFLEHGEKISGESYPQYKFELWMVFFTFSPNSKRPTKRVPGSNSSS